METSYLHDSFLDLYMQRLAYRSFISPVSLGTIKHGCLIPNNSMGVCLRYVVCFEKHYLILFSCLNSHAFLSVFDLRRQLAAVAIPLSLGLYLLVAAWDLTGAGCLHHGLSSLRKFRTCTRTTQTINYQTFACE